MHRGHPPLGPRWGSTDDPAGAGWALVLRHFWAWRTPWLALGLASLFFWQRWHREARKGQPDSRAQQGCPRDHLGEGLLVQVGGHLLSGVRTAALGSCELVVGCGTVPCPSLWPHRCADAAVLCEGGPSKCHANAPNRRP